MSVEKHAPLATRFNGWSIVREVSPEEVHEIPPPVIGRFVIALPPPTLDGSAELRGIIRKARQHERLALVWTNARQEEVLHEVDATRCLLMGCQRDANWLPEGWTIAVFPTGWTLAQLECWFTYALGIASDVGFGCIGGDDRPSDQFASHPYLPSHRDLVSHAHLIMRQLNYPDSWPEPRGMLDRSESVEELQNVLCFFRWTLNRRGDFAQESQTDLAGQTCSTYPLARLLSLVEKARSQILNASQRFPKDRGIPRPADHVEERRLQVAMIRDELNAYFLPRLEPLWLEAVRLNVRGRPRWAGEPADAASSVEALERLAEAIRNTPGNEQPTNGVKTPLTGLPESVAHAIKSDSDEIARSTAQARLQQEQANRRRAVETAVERLKNYAGPTKQGETAETVWIDRLTELVTALKESGRLDVVSQLPHRDTNARKVVLALLTFLEAGRRKEAVDVLTSVTPRGKLDSELRAELTETFPSDLLQALRPVANPARVIETERQDNPEPLVVESGTSSQRPTLTDKISAVTQPGPRQEDGPAPPDIFRWRGVTVDGLSSLQWRLLSALWANDRPQAAVGIPKLIEQLWDNQSIPSDPERALKSLKERTQRELDRAHVRLLIERVNHTLRLLPIDR